MLAFTPLLYQLPPLCYVRYPSAGWTGIVFWSQTQAGVKSASFISSVEGTNYQATWNPYKCMQWFRECINININMYHHHYIKSCGDFFIEVVNLVCQFSAWNLFLVFFLKTSEVMTYVTFWCVFVFLIFSLIVIFLLPLKCRRCGLVTLQYLPLLKLNVFIMKKEIHWKWSMSRGEDD